MILGISDRSMYKMLLAIKQRYKKHWVVWFSRLEHSRFWLSERRMYAFITALKKDRKLVKVGEKKWNNNPYKCNIYKLSKEFIEYLESVKEFVKKVFIYQEYSADDVINYVSSICKLKHWQYKLNIAWIYYIIATRWRFRWKIYDTSQSKIISLITLQKLWTN